MDAEKMLTTIYFDMMDPYYHKFGQNMKIFKILCIKYMKSNVVMRSSTDSFENS